MPKSKYLYREVVCYAWQLHPHDYIIVDDRPPRKVKNLGLRYDDIVKGKLRSVIMDGNTAREMCGPGIVTVISKWDSWRHRYVDAEVVPTRGGAPYAFTDAVHGHPLSFFGSDIVHWWKL